MCQFCDSCASNDRTNTTMYGTNAADLLVGGSLTDYIYGNEGDDSLSGHAGDDFIFGGEGNDSILGGLGDDYLTGDSAFSDQDSSSDDTLRGGNGNDEIFGGFGKDSLYGDSGNDRMFGGLDQDRLFAGQGNDYVNGNEGNDTLFGNKGNDTLFGGDGLDGDADKLFGGDGDDSLIGGLDNDTLNGGAGNDRFLFSGSRAFAEADLGIDRIQDFGNGNDTIVLDKRVFVGISGGNESPLSESDFAVVTDNAAAAIAEELIVYNSSNGRLYYNENGNSAGFGDGGQFAVLNAQPDLVAADFAVA